MPTTKAPTSQKKEKKDFKQEFLDLVYKNYGYTAVMGMEHALKNETKQLDAAMLSGGMSVGQIAQNQGLDMNLLSGITKTPPPSPQTQPTQPTENQPTQQPTTTRQPAGSMLSLGSETEQPGAVWKLLQFFAKGQLQGDTNKQLDPTLIAQREAVTKLMQMQIEGRETGKDVDKVYRNPVTGEEVDPEIAQKEMDEGIGVYQVNQKLSTRAGMMEKPLNKVPDLTQEEKTYINNANNINGALTTLGDSFDSLYAKHGKAHWQSFQMENIPYILAQDQSVQSLKSDLIYLKAQIPFLRGGKQLTKEEGKRIDIQLNPFGKSKETYKKDIDRFEKEFLYGADIMKYGINADLMRKIIKSDKKKRGQIQKQGDLSQMSDAELQAIISGGK